MAGIAAAIIGGAALTGVATYFGSQAAAKAQTSAAQTATNAQLQMFDTANTNLQPFIQGGAGEIPQLKETLNALSRLTTPGADMTDQLSQLPGFKFASEWGQRGVANQGTTTGLGGNTIAEGAKFATGLASTNWANLVQAILGTAGAEKGLVDTGANAAGTLAGNAVNTGGQVGSNIIGAGNATAGATMAGANAVGGLGSSLTTASLFAKLLGNNNMYGANSAPATG